MVSGYLTSTNLPLVDRLSTDPWELGRHTFTVVEQFPKGKRKLCHCEAEESKEEALGSLRQRYPSLQ